MLKAYRFMTVDCSEMPGKNCQPLRSEESDWTITGHDKNTISTQTKLLVILHDVYYVWYSQKY